ARPHLHSSPTRRSSDLALIAAERAEMVHGKVIDCTSPAAEIVPPPHGTRPPFVTCIAPLDAVLQTRGIVRMAWLVEAALFRAARSEEHTSELQSRENLV